MGWVIWVIVLIPVAVSILSLLFRPPKDEPRAGGRLRPGPQRGGGAGGQPRRSVNDIDLFLEEINRRRREAAQRRGGFQEPVAVPLPPPPRQRPVPPPAPKPSRRVERERDLPPRLRGRVAETEAVVIAEVIAPPAPEIPSFPGAATDDLLPDGQPGVVRRVQPISPALNQLMPLLQSPNGLRSAMLLREIFDRPVSARGPGRAVGRRLP
jgi:hypothetical protein